MLVESSLVGHELLLLFEAHASDGLRKLLGLISCRLLLEPVHLSGIITQIRRNGPPVVQLARPLAGWDHPHGIGFAVPRGRHSLHLGAPPALAAGSPLGPVHLSEAEDVAVEERAADAVPVRAGADVLRGGRLTVR